MRLFRDSEVFPSLLVTFFLKKERKSGRRICKMEFGFKFVGYRARSGSRSAAGLICNSGVCS